VRGITVGTLDGGVTIQNDRADFPNAVGDHIQLDDEGTAEQFVTVDGAPWTVFSLLQYDDLGSSRGDEYTFTGNWITGSGGTRWGLVVGDTTIEDGQIHSYAGTFDNTTVELWQDAISIGTNTAGTGDGDAGTHQIRYDAANSQWEFDVPLDAATRGSVYVGGTSQKDEDRWAGKIYCQHYWRRKLTAAEILSLHENPWQVYRPKLRLVGKAPGASAAVTGTAVSGGVLESEIVTGGDTVIITLTGDTFKAAGTGPIGTTAETQALIDGLDSAQSEGTGWNAEVRDNLVPADDVARTSATVATITIPATAAYEITADETITVTVPTDVLVTAAGAITGSPTFDVTNEAGAFTTRPMLLMGIGR